MEPFRVFISSIMNSAAEDLAGERQAARAAVERFAPITIALAFEAEPASPKPLLDFYLDAAKTCDVFMLVLGCYATKPVRDEVQVALDYRKAMLVFCKDVPEHSPETQELLRTLDVKYDLFINSVELQEKARIALGNHLLSLIRGDTVPSAHLGDRLARLRSFARQRRMVTQVHRGSHMAVWANLSRKRYQPPTQIVRAFIRDGFPVGLLEEIGV